MARTEFLPFLQQFSSFKSGQALVTNWIANEYVVLSSDDAHARFSIDVVLIC